MAFSFKNLVALIQAGVQHKASDVHIRSGETPCLRIRGDLVPIQTKEFSDADVEDICRLLFNNDQLIENINALKEWDGGFTVPNLCRIRFNYFRFQEKKAIILRIIPLVVPSLEELDLIPILSKIALNKRGLTLVTGTTGSGKSTTLAAMINSINRTRPVHIITIEDPIEYVYTQSKARISQREVGKDTESFASGLRSALREDPDIILIGEMRDTETISIALQATETGHAVFSTLHTTDAIATIGRIVAMFPPEQQKYVRDRLASNLFSTISQRMLKKTTTGIVVAQEIMITNQGVRECILEDEKFGRLDTIIKSGKGDGGNGSQSFDQHLLELLEAKIISEETAIEAATSGADFVQRLLIDNQ